MFIIKILKSLNNKTSITGKIYRNPRCHSTTTFLSKCFFFVIRRPTFLIYNLKLNQIFLKNLGLVIFFLRCHSTTPLLLCTEGCRMTKRIMIIEEQ